MKLNLQSIIAVGIGGALGGMLRQAIELGMQNQAPFGTVVINLTGTLVSAFLVVVFANKLKVTQPVADFALVGILGAYTTYSSAILDMVKHGWLIAIPYLLLSLFGGVAVVFIGRWLARKVVAL
ncbi:MAG: CrcB family protein [Lactobacillaceae bacterium]|jgi:CrcB protein|nr:CrcB family protein [Lactobacillaceae bacterium]